MTMQITEQMITRASEVLWSEAIPPAMADVNNFTDAQVTNGELRKADEACDRENRDLVRRALERALSSDIQQSELGDKQDREIVIVKATKTSDDVPSQWDAWDSKGQYWYIRFRAGRGTISRGYDIDEAVASFFDTGAPVNTLQDICVYLGISYCLDLDLSGVTFEEKPPVS